jgi:molecular chaperone IbpA
MTNGYPYNKNPHENDWLTSPQIYREPTKKVVAAPAAPTIVDILINRGIGFKNQFAFFEELMSTVNKSNFPPYDILSIDKDNYLIRFAVAGFSKEDIEVTLDKNALVVKGNKEEEEDNTDAYFYKGIAARSFTQTFPLAEHIEVVSADLKDGILSIKLERNLPDELKPKTIKIK